MQRLYDNSQDPRLIQMPLNATVPEDYIGFLGNQDMDEAYALLSIVAVQEPKSRGATTRGARFVQRGTHPIFLKETPQAFSAEPKAMPHTTPRMFRTKKVRRHAGEYGRCAAAYASQEYDAPKLMELVAHWRKVQRQMQELSHDRMRLPHERVPVDDEELKEIALTLDTIYKQANGKQRRLLAKRLRKWLDKRSQRGAHGSAIKKCRDRIRYRYNRLPNAKVVHKDHRSRPRISAANSANLRSEFRNKQRGVVAEWADQRPSG